MPSSEKAPEYNLCDRKDEHSLIAAYCQKLSEGHLSHLIPESPMQVNTKCQSRPISTNLNQLQPVATNRDQSQAQVASEIDGEQRKELEHMILELEAENANLKVEQRCQCQCQIGSTET